MRLSIAILACLAAAMGVDTPSVAQTQLPGETRNAALRYWQAMTELPDPLADSLTQAAVGQTEEGLQPWDESKLGPILDANMAAIEEMQRATKLPECDWGFEYSRGARASVSHVMRARVLARLNTLYGMRLMAKGQSQEALEAWLDGVKFAQDIGKGGPVILQLIGRAALLPDLQAMTSAANADKFSAQQKMQIAASIGALTPDVFEWSAAFGLEEVSGEMFLNEVRAAKDPAIAYREIAGTAMPAEYKFKMPSDADIVAFRALTAQAQAALQTPPEDAQESLETLQGEIGHSQRYLAGTVPSLVLINEARAQIVTARAALLKSVGG